MEKLTEEQIRTALPSLPAWELHEGRLTRLFKFREFYETMAFVNRVAALAEAADHHPDIDIRYNQVRLTLSTHSAGGLTEKDFSLARQLS